MMKHAQLLDCTLRDGAYLVDKKFGDEVIHGVTAGLVKAGTDIIEIGFLQDEGFGEGKPVFLNAAEAEKYIPGERGNALFTVLADFSRYSIDNLDEYTGKSFDAVRACFFKHERFDVIDFCKEIRRKGYKVFVQPVDAMGYTDTELVEFIELVNEFEPYCFSIVDTFGSMYEEDLQRLYSIIDHNLCYTSKIGFHSHNNMQMSSALTQAFLRITFGHREVVVDSTISGMGRGAGNTPTELLAQYMVDKLGYHYDIDIFLDLIDDYINPIRSQASWGYNTHMFLAGMYSAHVNNISYLKKKNSIHSKDIRFILDRVGPKARKRYHYDLLEDTYLNYMDSDIDDSEDVESLRRELAGSNVVIIAPGRTATTEADKIAEYIKENHAKVISINYIPESNKPDYLYMNNVKRYTKYLHKADHGDVKKIFTSNLKARKDENTFIISFSRLFKCGWEYADNSAILLLRLLDAIGVRRVGIAGMDGYAMNTFKPMHYANISMELPVEGTSAVIINREISEMLKDFAATNKSGMVIDFVTTSRFSEEFS